MIVVAIVAILAAIAVPSYRDYVLRGQLSDGTNGLATFRADMERYFQDNRTYLPVGGFVPPCDASRAASLRTVGTFVITCDPALLTATSYGLVATGSNSTADFIFTLNQQGLRGTTQTVAGWGTYPATCWLLKRGLTC